MGKVHLLRGAFATVTFVALAVMAVCARSSTQTEHNDEFVQRDGAGLTLGGETFRYGRLVCDKCAIDSDMGWPDLSPKGLMSAKCRITA